MDDSEILVLIFSTLLAVAGIGAHTTGAFHPLYFRDNPAPGIVRLGVILAMVWIGYVLGWHADPSVTGPYVVFYLVMGYAAVKVFGQSGAALLGFRTRVDAAERGNVASALVTAAFVLSTGLVFGGSLWGEADPTGDGEGGWWIPVGFFVAGWICLVAAFMLYRSREARGLARRLQRERTVADGRAAALFLLASAVALTDAVSGDFWGWRHGLLTFGLLAGLLLVHEAFAAATYQPEGGTESKRSDDQDDGDFPLPRRTMEAVLYGALALLAWVGNRLLDVLLGAS